MSDSGTICAPMSVSVPVLGGVADKTFELVRADLLFHNHTRRIARFDSPPDVHPSLGSEAVREGLAVEHDLYRLIKFVTSRDRVWWFFVPYAVQAENGGDFVLNALVHRYMQ